MPGNAALSTRATLENIGFRSPLDKLIVKLQTLSVNHEAISSVEPKPIFSNVTQALSPNRRHNIFYYSLAFVIKERVSSLLQYSWVFSYSLFGCLFVYGISFKTNISKSAQKGNKVSVWLPFLGSFYMSTSFYFSFLRRVTLFRYGWTFIIILS